MYDISLKEWSRKDLVIMFGKFPNMKEQIKLLVEYPRSKERIIMFHVENGTIGKLYDKACSNRKKDIAEIIAILQGKTFTEYIADNADWENNVPVRFKKALNLWQVAAQRKALNEKKKERMRKYFVETMSKEGLTQSHIATAVNISKGNLSSFLNGNNAALSIESCYKILEYVLKFKENL